MGEFGLIHFLTKGKRGIATVYENDENEKSNSYRIPFFMDTPNERMWLYSLINLNTSDRWLLLINFNK